MLDGHLLLAATSVSLECLDLRRERPGELVEGVLGAVLLRDSLDVRQFSGEGHCGHMNGRHLGGEHRLNLIARLSTLNAVEREVPAGKTIHAILDNYAAHKHPVARKWLARHPRWTFHFTPTSASWLNAVEGFFAILTKRRLKRGVFRSVADLQAAINRFLDHHNAQSKPFQWVADPDKIIVAVRRGHQALDSIH
jgi:DDE superfamily endonuclease